MLRSPSVPLLLRIPVVEALVQFKLSLLEGEVGDVSAVEVAAVIAVGIPWMLVRMRSNFCSSSRNRLFSVTSWLLLDCNCVVRLAV